MNRARKVLFQTELSREVPTKNVQKSCYQSEFNDDVFGEDPVKESQKRLQSLVSPWALFYLLICSLYTCISYVFGWMRRSSLTLQITKAFQSNGKGYDKKKTTTTTTYISFVNKSQNKIIPTCTPLHLLTPLQTIYPEGK